MSDRWDAIDTDNPHSKYVLFRNYMMNELGISKEDIKQWTKEAVYEIATKLVGQINVSAMIEAAAARQAVTTASSMRSAIADIIARKIEITVHS